MRRQQPGYTVSKLFLFFITEDAGKTLSRTSYGLSSSLTEKTRKSNCLPVSALFLFIYIKTLSDGPARGLNQWLPAQETGDCDIYFSMFIYFTSHCLFPAFDDKQ